MKKGRLAKVEEKDHFLTVARRTSHITSDNVVICVRKRIRKQVCPMFDMVIEKMRLNNRSY